MKGNKGFTLIELIIVIVILGILGALIVPRFAALDKEARIAATNGLEGSMRSAAAIAHSMSLAQSLAHNASVLLEGQTVTMVQFYPTADSAGITASLGGATGISGFTDSGAGVYTKDGSPTPANCSVTYTAAAAGGSPGFVKVTTGC